MEDEHSKRLEELKRRVGAMTGEELSDLWGRIIEIGDSDEEAETCE